MSSSKFSFIFQHLIFQDIKCLNNSLFTCLCCWQKRALLFLNIYSCFGKKQNVVFFRSFYNVDYLSPLTSCIPKIVLIILVNINELKTLTSSE